MKKFIGGLIVFMGIPFMVGAATIGNIGNVLTFFTDLINALMPFIVALAVLFFVWGVFQFVMAAGDEEGRKTGRDKMIYGIIGIFVMVSVWGLVNILQGSIALDPTAQTPTSVPPATTSGL